jgi:hypothetical protein
MKSANKHVVTLYYPPELKNQWPKPLAHGWLRQYPQIFDADDLRQTVEQSRAHFGEWFVAIHLYKSLGALSLLEKYCYHNHARKVRILDEVLSPPDCRFIRSFRAEFGVQPPDLFVYMPDTGHFWFVEVKGTDRLSNLQAESHVAIRKRFGVDVQIFHVRPIRAGAAQQSAYSGLAMSGLLWLVAWASR